MSPKRAPVKKKGKKPKGKKVPKSPKIKKDPLKEYQQAVKKDSEGAIEIIALTDEDSLANVPIHIGTQSLELDRLLNGMGYPSGRVVEIYGPPHIGKSTLLDHAFAEVQKMGGVAVLFDTETARDVNYTGRIGVDTKKLQYVKFARGEMHVENVLMQIFKAIEFWREKAPDMPVVLGWDALGGTATRDELEKQLEKDARPAMAAQVLRTAVRQLPTKLGNTKISVIICNHEYQTFGKGKKQGFKETYGGGAVKHLATLRLQMWNVGWIKGSGGEIIGRKVGVNLKKNRLGKMGSVEVAMLTGIGIDNTHAVLDRLKAAKLIATAGGWSAINLDGEKINFQGWQGLVKKCEEDETLFPRLVSVYKSLE